MTSIRPSIRQPRGPCAITVLRPPFRTCRGAHRSLNAEASMAAVGAQAEWFTRDHPSDYGYGPGSPLAKLVESGGKVLMLGAPLDTITLLHYAENRANLRHKAVVRYSHLVLRDGEKVQIDVEDFDTGDPHDDYSFEGIAQDYLAAGNGRQGKVGDADTYLFDAADLVRYAINWLKNGSGFNRPLSHLRLAPLGTPYMASVRHGNIPKFHH